MNPIRILLLALMISVTAHAQTAPPAKPTQPVKPVQAVKPVPPVRNVEQSDRPATDDEELAIAALEGLMAQPPERALPILKKVLAGSQPTVVKRRALFVLAQIDAPEARELLIQSAHSPIPELRTDAIRSIGISGNEKALDSLQDIYKTADAGTKRDILQSWMIAGRKEMVYQAALNAKTEDEASDAIRMLGVMGATEELRKLSDKPNSQRGLVDALGISGDLEGLRKIAEGNGDREVRVDAVRKIGIIQNDAARAALRDLYTRSTDRDIKDAALQGMLIAQDDQGVLALYKAAKTTDEKRTLLRTLSMMDSDVALQAIDATLEKKP